MKSTVTCMDRVSARIGFFIVITAVFVILSAAKLAGIQIRHHSEYLSRADDQQSIQVQVEARRGQILDRNGYLLAGNLTRATFTVFWPNVPADMICEIDSFAAGLGCYLEPDMPLTPSGRNEVLAENVPWENAVDIIESMSRYVDCRFTTSRIYPMGEVMTPVIGTHNENGSQGLEYHMEEILEGTDGLNFYQKSAWSGLNAIDTEAENVVPVHGRDIELTIDARYQEIAQRELAEAVEYSGSAWGAIVVMDPSSGDILALASYPVYNQDGSLARNNCIQSSHEPGSVFKAITLSAALDGGYACLSDSFDCTSNYVELFGYRIHDSHPIGAVLSLREVIEQSSNVGTVEIAGSIPDSALYQYCADFGFGSRTRIDFPGEQSGELPETGAWSGLSKANLAIGQEVSVTPLQLAMAFGAIANGGVLNRPRIFRATFEDGIHRPLALSPGRRVISEETAAEVRSILHSVVTTGTGSAASVSGVTVAGKTGTAERLLQGGYLSAFAGMVPADNPRLVAVVVFDQPDYELRWGSALAAPVFQRVVSGILSTSPEIALGEPAPAGEFMASGGPQ